VSFEEERPRRKLGRSLLGSEMAPGFNVRFPVNVVDHMQGMHFPASKQDFLLRARDNGAGQDMLEVLESFPDGQEFETLDDLVKAYGESDQGPQTGILERKPQTPQA
jgi:hypothetical protein